MTQPEVQPEATQKTALGTGAQGDLAHPEKDAEGTADAAPVAGVVPTEAPAAPVEGA